MVPNGERGAHYGDIQVEHAPRIRCVDRPHCPRLSRRPGDDRVKFINGQVTTRGRFRGGCYAALVNAKAKMQADLNIYRSRMN